MSIISEKVSYLNGLMDGMDFDKNSNEGKLFSGILSVLGEIADELDFVDETQDELSDAVYDLEDEVYGEDDYDEEDEDEPFIVNCPNCEKDFYVYEDDLESDDPIECPYCGQEVELEFDCEADTSDSSDDE